MMITTNSSLAAALEYHERGFNVVALRSHSCTPTVRWSALRNNRADKPQIETWWTETTDAEPGVILDEQSRITMLDVDEDRGEAALQRLGVPTTLTVRSRRGLHRFYKLPESLNYPTSVKDIVPGVELKANCVTPMPPASHRESLEFTYSFPNDEQAEIAEAPRWLCEKLAARSNREAAEAQETARAWGELLREISGRNEFELEFTGEWSVTGTRALQCLFLENHLGGDEHPSAYIYTQGGAGFACSACAQRLSVLGLGARVGYADDQAAVAEKLAERGFNVPGRETESNPDANALATASRSTRRLQAADLVRLAESSASELFHDSDNDAYIAIQVNGHRETWNLKSDGFRDWLSRSCYTQLGFSPSSSVFDDATRTLVGRARYDGPEYDVALRIAEHSSDIFVDLCDANWRVVRISALGWSVQSNEDVPVRFRRDKGMLPLPEPQHGGTVAELRSFVNVADADWPLLLVWLVAALRPNKPFPVLPIGGEQGSAKSSTARVLRQLIDPSVVPLQAPPKNESDVILAARNSWLLVFDNLSHVPEWLSDALCRLATGGGIRTRKLYTDAEEVLFSAKRPIALNGIGNLATRGDLLERSIPLTLPTIADENRRAEADFWTDFQVAQPRIIGALYDAVSFALANLDNARAITESRLPRMADFAQWATAAESALGLADGEFLRAYATNQVEANEIVLEEAVAERLVAFMETQSAWSGTATELLAALTDVGATTKPKGWPADAKSLSRALTRLAPNLRRAGIEIDRGRGKRRIITISKPAVMTVKPAPDGQMLLDELCEPVATAEADPPFA